MVKRTAFFLTVLAILIALLNPAHARAAAPGVDFKALLNQRMPGLLAKYRVPGAVISYIQDGEVAWTQAYGVANLATSQPMQPGKVFNFGSCGKVLTAWGVMRLVEQGKVDLDAPANSYLKRWQIPAGQYGPQKVTVRMLLSHTAGLTVHGFTDYSPRRSLPSLVEALQGQNQLDGPVVLFQEPGQGFSYSGGGYTLLQMIIEDVSGLPFAQFMQNEVAGPLGLTSLHWTWTPDLTATAPVPYGPQQEPLEYRQLAVQAIGSEIATVPDFARFIAAAISGPQGQHAAADEGLAYGVTSTGTGVLLQHFGANSGWNAFFSIDTGLREGLVMAVNSSNGFPLNAAVQNLWRSVLGGGTTAFEPAPEPDVLPLQSEVYLALAGLFTLALLTALVIFVINLRHGRRAWSRHPSRAGLVGAGVWLALALFWVYWFYTSLPLFFPPSFTDLWHTPQVDLVLASLLAWMAFSAAAAWCPKVSQASAPHG